MPGASPTHALGKTSRTTGSHSSASASNCSAVGSGTASRETDAFIDSVLRSSEAKAAKVTVMKPGLLATRAATRMSAARAASPEASM